MNALEQYTETSRTDHEMAKLTLARLLKGRDYDGRMSATALAEHVPVSASTVRDLVKEVRRERGIAVYACWYVSLRPTRTIHKTPGRTTRWTHEN